MVEYKSDIEIARAANKKPIMEIGAKLGIPSEDLLPYGHDKAKVGQDFIARQEDARRQADPRHRDQPDARGRGQDHDHGGPGRRAEPPSARRRRSASAKPRSGRISA
jgi:hypothetical protein